MRVVPGHCRGWWVGLTLGFKPARTESARCRHVGGTAAIAIEQRRVKQFQLTTGLRVAAALHILLGTDFSRRTATLTYRATFMTKDCQRITNTSGALGGCPETSVFHQVGRATGEVVQRGRDVAEAANLVQILVRTSEPGGEPAMPAVDQRQRERPRQSGQPGDGQHRGPRGQRPNVVPPTRQRRRRPPPKVCPSRGEHCAAQIAVLRPRSINILLFERVTGSPRLYLTVHVIVRQVGAGRAVAPVAARSLSAAFQTSPVGDGLM